jgi:predicted peroxiredoxin
MADNGRVIVGCTHGEEDSDRVLVAYLTAGAADRIRAGQDPPVERVHAQFIEKGGRFYVCPICFNERELDHEQLVEARS